MTIAHPFGASDPVCTGCTWITFHLRPETAHRKVWNAPWAGRHNERALRCWYDLLASGKRVGATAGTDAHGPVYLSSVRFICTPTTSNLEALISQLHSGLTYLSGSARLKPAFLTADGPVRLGGEGQPGPWEALLVWTAIPPGSVLTFVVDGERSPELLTSTTGTEHLVRRFEVRQRPDVEF